MSAEPCGAVEPLQSAWLDGQLDAGERDRVARHLQSCACCRARVDGLDRTRALLAAAPVRMMPPPLRAALGTPPARAGGLASAPLAARPTATTRPELGIPRRGGRVLTYAIGVVGVVAGVAFAVGGQPSPDSREVDVPVELYVADHMVRAIGGPVSTPVILER